MPTATEKMAKVESKQGNEEWSKESSGGPEQPNRNPVEKVIDLIDKKIRNLEKRRQKLIQYRDNREGKELADGQLEAISHLSEVEHHLEFARELNKSVQMQLKDYEKSLIETQRIEKAEQQDRERKQIADVLMYQGVLENMKRSEVKECFVNGTNGACQLSDGEFEVLDKLYAQICPLKGHLSLSEWTEKVSESAVCAHGLVNAISKQRILANYTGKMFKNLLDRVAACEIVRDSWMELLPVEKEGMDEKEGEDNEPRLTEETVSPAESSVSPPVSDQQQPPSSTSPSVVADHHVQQASNGALDENGGSLVPEISEEVAQDNSAGQMLVNNQAIPHYVQQQPQVTYPTYATIPAGYGQTNAVFALPVVENQIQQTVPGPPPPIPMPNDKSSNVTQSIESSGHQRQKPRHPANEQQQHRKTYSRGDWYGRGDRGGTPMMHSRGNAQRQWTPRPRDGNDLHRQHGRGGGGGYYGEEHNGNIGYEQQQQQYGGRAQRGNTNRRGRGRFARPNFGQN